MKTFIRLLQGTLLCAFIASGCTHTVKKVVNIEAYDSLKFSVKEITASPGQEIELTLKVISNLPKSAMSHNWVLLKKSTDVKQFVTDGIQHKDTQYVAPKDKQDVIATTGLVGGGESKTITFKAPKEKGEYTFVCTFPGHYQAGMKGKFIVK